jgi:magnesium-transporting ATPase (P-type)
LLSLWYLKEDFYQWVIIYLFFYWFWLTYVAGKSVRHPMTNKFGKSLTNTNTALSLMTIISIAFTLILSPSFLARMIFAFSGFYSVVLYSFLLSISVHIYITTKNILTINQNQDKVKLVLGLLVYPFGIWTIQETLKQKKPL